MPVQLPDHLCRTLRSVLVVALLVTCCPVPAGTAAGDEQPPGSRFLQVQIDLATAPAFYLLLDEAAAELRLMLHGVALDTAAVTRVEVGRPQVLFMASTPPAWRGVVWEDGVLRPDRPARPGVAAAAAPTPLPPTAEEAIPVPPRYVIRFGGGLALEIHTTPAEGDAARPPWWRRAAGALAGRTREVAAAVDGDRDRVRLRLELDGDDAARLYRSLPPDVRLLAVPAA